MAKYSKAAGKKVETAMHEMKEGKLKSGRSGKKVTSPKQAIAIGLSEAREKGARVPTKNASKSSGRAGKKASGKGGKKAASKSSGGSRKSSGGTKKSAPHKIAAKSSTGRKSATKASGGGGGKTGKTSKSPSKKSASKSSR